MSFLIASPAWNENRYMTAVTMNCSVWLMVVYKKVLKKYAKLWRELKIN